MARWKDLTDEEKEEQGEKLYKEKEKKSRSKMSPEERASADKEQAEAELAYDVEKLAKQEKIVERMKEVEKLKGHFLDLDEMEIDNQIKKLELLEEEERLSKGISAERQKELLDQKGQLEGQKEGLKTAESMLNGFLGISKEGHKMFENWGGKIKGVEKGLKKTLTSSKGIKNIMAGGLIKMAQATAALAIAQDQAVSSFKKATGASNEYNNNIRGLERSMYNTGVSAADAAKAVGALYNNVSDYTTMGEMQQRSLEKNVAVLDKLGVSVETSTKNIQFMTKVMGQSTDQALASSRELFKFAQDLGVSAEKLSADFIKAQGLVASLGDTGMDAFKGMQVQAKATGLSMDTLLSTVAKFDTFSSAATHVGKLNAILGGPYLNTLEMVAETDPTERLKKLSAGIRASGTSFDEMSYYEKKAMTAAAGLNSEMELALFMSGKLETARGPVKTQADFETLAAQTKDFNDVMDEMKQLGISLAISLGPVVEIVKTIFDGLTKIAPILKVVIGLYAIWAAVSFTQALMASIGSFGGAVAAGVAAMAIVGGIAGASSWSGMGGSGGSIPGFAPGSGATPGGPAMLAERGPENVTTPGGASFRVKSPTVASVPKGSKVAANGSAAFSNPDVTPLANAGAGGGKSKVDIELKADDNGILQYLASNLEFKDGPGQKGTRSMSTHLANKMST